MNYLDPYPIYPTTDDPEEIRKTLEFLKDWKPDGWEPKCKTVACTISKQHPSRNQARREANRMLREAVKESE